MYCIKCGVRLADTEQKCPLCNTSVYHPEIAQPIACPLYPKNKMPKAGAGKKALSGMIILLFLIPFVVSFFSDLQADGRLDWFGYVAGALVVSYVIFALPLWFRKPNPVIFVPCNFVVTALYLLYIDLATDGHWFLDFALPVICALAVITCTVVTLVHYVGRGKLYIFGGATIALGALILMIELLLVNTFGVLFVGWSVYPLVVLALLGGTMIYLAINRIARETIERKLFF